MLRKIVSIGALAALLALPGLAHGDGTAPATASTPTQVAASSDQWKAMVRAAKREGQVEVMLGGQMPRQLRKIMPEFT